MTWADQFNFKTKFYEVLEKCDDNEMKLSYDL